MSSSFSYQQLLKQQMSIPNTLLTEYKSLGLNETEVMMILQIHRYLLSGNDFPTPDELASFLTIDEKECANILRLLIQKGFLTIEKSQYEKLQLRVAYNLDQLW